MKWEVSSLQVIQFIIGNALYLRGHVFDIIDKFRRPLSKNKHSHAQEYYQYIKLKLKRRQFIH